MTYVLGAPGSGKTTLVPLLRTVLPTHIVVDWDAYMSAAGELAQRDIRRSPSTWPSYRGLVRAVVETIHPAPLVLLGVCTPDELEGWPIDETILLDCNDEELQLRLRATRDACDIDVDVDEALADAARYRSLDLPRIDTTHRTPEAISEELAERILRAVQ
jgi:broad-specificity NMP kinase